MDLSDVSYISTVDDYISKITHTNSSNIIWQCTSPMPNKYIIRSDNAPDKSVTINQLRKMITNDEVDIGSELIVSYTDPYNHVTYDCPFVFGALKDWILRDGTTKYGLGLQTVYSLPTQSMQYGSNNDYGASNIRSFLTTTLLNCFPADFVNSLAEVYIPLYNVYDKFFALSNPEMNVICTDSGWAYTNDSEGSHWQIYQQKTNSTDYLNLPVSRGTIFSDIDLRGYNIEDKTTKSNVWSRGKLLANNGWQWVVVVNGISNDYVSGSNRLQPACVILGA